MSTWINVARYQLIDRRIHVQPWIALALSFAVNFVIVANIPPGSGQARYVGGLAAMYLALLIVEAVMFSRQLPFALALGMSRRSYYVGTALLALIVAAAYGVTLTALQVVEGATGGWGWNLNFFRVPYLLAGPWYLTWLTSFVGLSLVLAWGIWFGIVYRRWNEIGLGVFIAAQALALTGALLVVAGAHAWQSVAGFFTSLTVARLTGLLAVLAVALLAGGYATIRRTTV